MWDYLSKTNRNIVLYGRGNAAERIMKELERRGKKPAGFFASDGFVRDKEFHGYPVVSYRDAFIEYGADMIVLLCFGSHRDDVIQNILHIAIETEFYAPDLPVIPEYREDGSEILFTQAYKDAHEEQLQKVFNALADDQSRRVFMCVNKYRLTGKIQYIVNCETPDSENWAILEPSAADRFMDLGAYTGDTVEEFIKYAGGEPASICAVEPEERNFRKLSENTEALKNCRLINMAVSDRAESVEFSKGGGRGSLQGKTKLVQADSVDHILGWKDDSDEPGEAVDIIKMDLEGAEGKAIAGAARTIKTYKPRMLVSAYHRVDDLWSLPLQVLELNPDYKVYLRHSHCLPAWEVNFYFK